MRARDDADDADEEQLDSFGHEQRADDDENPRVQVDGEAAPTVEDAPQTSARPNWGASGGDETIAGLPADEDEAAEPDGGAGSWRACLHDRNAHFKLCGRITTRRNLLRIVLSPGGILVLAFFVVVASFLGWLGPDEGSLSGEPQGRTLDDGERAAFFG